MRIITLFAAFIVGLFIADRRAVTIARRESLTSLRTFVDSYASE